MGGPWWFIARTQIRRRWRALVLLTVFVGLVGGVSLSLIAGSRRSSSVVDRYLATARRYDFQVYAPWLDQRTVAGLHGVRRADPGAYLGMVAGRSSATQPQGVNGYVVDFDATDPTNRVLAGRLPTGRPSEVAVNEAYVKEFHRSVGDFATVRMFAKDQGDEVSAGKYDARGPRYRFRIVGVVRIPTDIAGDEAHSIGANAYGSLNAMFVPVSFFDRHRDEFLDFGESFQVVLAPGVTGHAFLREANARRPPGGDAALVGPVSSGERRQALATPVALETTALLALGVGLALVGAIAIALVLRAEQRLHDTDENAYRTLGTTRAHLGLVAALRMAPVAIGGALIAIGLAVALSPRYPIGIGRELELHRGPSVNVTVLGVGVLAVVVLVVGVSFLLGLPRPDRRSPATRRLTLARWLGRSGAPADLVLGTQLAFERGRGVRAVPSRQAIVAGALALALVAGISVYVAGVDHLDSTPRAHGWPWDAAVGNVNFPLAASTARRLGRDGRVERRTRGRNGIASVNGRATEVLAYDPRGDAPPEVVSGRLPQTASEIALGHSTLDELGVDIGSTVRFSVAGGDFDTGRPGRTRTLRVVGEALTPIFGEADLGAVGIVPFSAVAAAGGDASSRLVFVNLRRPDRAALRALDRDYTEEIVTDIVPARIVNLHRVRALPLIGLLLAGALGTLVLAYTLAVSVRARRHELAILRALGMRGRGVGRVLVWQGLVLGTGVVVLGLPLGLAVGAAVWSRVADGLGVAGTAVIDPRIWLLVPLALLVAVGASLYPSRRARRQRVVTLLRVE